MPPIDKPSLEHRDTRQDWRTSDSAILINVREHLDEACVMQDQAQLYDALDTMRHAAEIASGKGNERSCAYCAIEDQS